MEYRIVPTAEIKYDESKHKKRDPKDKTSKHSPLSEEVTYRIYSLQPSFKAPKSTRDVNSPDENNKDLATIQQVSDKNINCFNEFNHFTMSRPGPMKTPDTGFKDNDKQNKPYSVNAIQTSTYCVKHKQGSKKLQETEISSYSKRKSSQDSRRTSVGDENVSTAQPQRGRRSIPNESTGSRPLPTSNNVSSKSQASSPRNIKQHNDQRRRSSGSKPLSNDVGQAQLKVPDSQKEPRRKSLYEGRFMEQWYSQETRPVSSDRCERSRRNVISPETLSRLGYNPEDKKCRGGSAGLSLCTEDDWKTYGSNFPQRRLVSHKQLNQGYRLPYNDNIGLEETVTSDQAKKAAKTKHHKQRKKQCKPSKQTPKQVWYRTVRSILAANYLYHYIQKKNKQKNL